MKCDDVNIGRVFGKLKIISRANNKITNKSKHIMYHCLCECGNTVTVSYSNLLTGNTKSCGCLKLKSKRFIDLTGQRFNNLTVVERLENRIRKTDGRKVVQWKCLCDCGNYTTVEPSNLKSGHTTSCGCNRNGRFIKRQEDLFIGKLFGYLEVVSKYNDNDFWNCVCRCGKTVVVEGSNLVSGNTKSCGCYQRERARNTLLLDLKGFKFGKLTAIEQVENNKFDHTQWLCKCECGGIIITETIRLRAGKVGSCGCLKSNGERKINLLLQKHKIKFIPQYSFADFIFKKSKRHGCFDFGVLDNNNALHYVIEYDGSFHYGYSNSGWNTKEHYEKVHDRDVQKNAYCLNNGIPLIRIPYYIYDELSINDLLVETSKYLVTTPDIEEAEELISEN